MSLETIVFIPAGMKPMHAGHLHLIEKYSNNIDVKEVRIIIGPSSRGQIDQQLAVDISQFLTKDMPKVKIVETDLPTPVTCIYKYMENVEHGNYAIGAAYKSEDYKTVLKFVENFSNSGKYANYLPKSVNAIELIVDLNPLLYVGRNDEYNGTPMSASVIRKDIINKDIKSFLTNYPGIPMDRAITVWNMIISKTSNNSNLHMQHIEDLIFNDGLSGIIKCKNLMEKTLNTFNKNNEDVKITTKYDGAPAIFCWSSFPGLPDNGIALKGLFNNVPQTITTVSEILSLPKPTDLRRKLIKLLKYLPGLKVPAGEIWQGDFLYDSESLSIEDINGYPALSFQPNTISYSPKTMIDYIRIKNSELGLIWHTIYYGSSINDVKCHYNIDISRLGDVPEIYMIDHMINYDKLSPIDLTYTTYTDYIDKLMELGTNEKYLELIGNYEFVKYLTMFFNSLIRECVVLNSHKVVDKLKFFVRYKFLSIIESKKTQKTQMIYQNRCDTMLNLIEDNRDVITRMYHIMIKITGIKIAFINHVDQYSTFYTHFKLTTGKFNETNHEGYAITDGYNIAKFVNRHEFSSSNFSGDVVKGWTK